MQTVSGPHWQGLTFGSQHNLEGQKSKWPLESADRETALYGCELYPIFKRKQESRGSRKVDVCFTLRGDRSRQSVLVRLSVSGYTCTVFCAVAKLAKNSKTKRKIFFIFFFFFCKSFS